MFVYIIHFLTVVEILTHIIKKMILDGRWKGFLYLGVKNNKTFYSTRMIRGHDERGEEVH